MKPLVIVRPEPGASTTVAAAERLGLRVVAMPLFAVEPVDWQAPDAAGFDALLLTSSNAIRHGGRELGHLRGLPAHCVGEATAVAARAAGFEIASIGGGGIDALLECVPSSDRLLHLGGAERRMPTRANHSIETVTVYDAVALPPPPEFAQIEGSVVAVHSPRAARRVAELADQLNHRRGAIAIAAISTEAAAAAGTGWQRIETATEPTDSALLALAARLCKNPA